MKKKLIICVSICVIVFVVLVFPFLTNVLMFAPAPKYFAPNGVEENSVWVGFFATYYGAIIGGLISGTITLFGVILTIRNQDKKDMINAYPEKRMKGDKILEKLASINKLNNELQLGNYGTAATKIRELSNCADTLLEQASKVSGNCYIAIRNINRLVEEYMQIVNGRSKYEFETNPILYHDQKRDEYQELIQRIEFQKEILEQDIINLSNKYEKIY